MSTVHSLNQQLHLCIRLRKEQVHGRTGRDEVWNIFHLKVATFKWPSCAKQYVFLTCTFLKAAVGVNDQQLDAIKLRPDEQP